MVKLVEAAPLPERTLSAPMRRRLQWTAVALAFTFVALAVIAAGRYSADLDETVRIVVALERHPWLDQPMRKISRWSSGYVLLPLTVIASVWLWRRCRLLGVALPAVALATVVVSSLTKWIVRSQRPSRGAYAFPSGHVLGAVVFLGMLVYLLWALDVPRRWRAAGTIVSIAAIAVVAVSRLYVNAHWVTDVLGSLAVGTSLVLFAVTAVDRRLAERRRATGRSAARAAGRPGPL